MQKVRGKGLRAASLLGTVSALMAAMIVVPSPAVLAARATQPDGGSNVPAFAAGPIDDGLGTAVAVSDGRAVLGAPDVNNGAGAAYIFVHKAQSWTLQQILTDPLDDPADGFGGAVAMSGPIAVVGAADTKPGGAAYVYMRSDGRWHLQAVLTAPHEARAASFGGAIALSGNTAIIGAESANNVAGAAYVFVRSGTRWHLQATLAETHQHRGDRFGWAVALAGTTAVITAIGWSNSQGTAYVYERSGSEWPLQARLADPAHHRQDSYGWSADVSGATIVIGALAGSKGAGTAYVYGLAGKAWQLAATLTSPVPGAGDAFGWAVSVTDLTVMVGDWNADYSGVVFVYVHSGSTWREQAILKPPSPPQTFGNFGISLAVSGGTMVIAAPFTNVGAGEAYVYAQSGSRWQAQSDLTDPRGGPGRFKGASVAVSSTTAAIGAWGADDLAGAAYIYALSQGIWRRQTTLKDPGNEYLDLFGSSVAVSGRTVIVGAPGAQGLNGRAYVYVRSGGRWRRQGTLSSPSGGGDFGSAVALYGNTAVIGALDARGFAGAAYVYARSGTRWHRDATLDGPRGACCAYFGSSVALYGGTIAVGAPGARKWTGAAYVYDRSGARWHRQAVLTDPRRRPNDIFGTSVAVTSATVVAGAPGVHNEAGATYIYGRSGTHWHKQAALTVAPTASPAGGFGGAVAISGTGRNAEALISGLSVSGLAATKTQCGSAFEFTRPSGRWRLRARVADPRCQSYDEFGYALSIFGQTAFIGAPGADHCAGEAYVLTLLRP
jgi:hypothetical protein